MKKTFFSLLLLTFVLVAPLAHANADASPANKWSFSDNFNRVSVGVVALTRPDFIGSDKQETDVFPMIQGQYNFNQKNAIYFRGISFGYEHRYNQNLKFGIDTGARSSRKEDDDPRLAGMGDISTAFEVGPWVDAEISGFSLKSKLMFDVSGEHGGFVGDLKLSKRLVDFGRQAQLPTLDLYAETSWGSGDFMDTYFDVTPAQALASRPAFNADAGFYQSAMGAVFMYAVRKNIFLRLDGKVQFLHGDAKNSGVTFDNTNFQGFLGVGYTF